jgi:hypothetical protein
MTTNRHNRILNVDAYPCYWPEGWPRTARHARKSSHYQVTFARARDEISRRLRLMYAAEIVISTNIPLRRDGLPLAGTAQPEDPAVAVYWAERGAYTDGRQQYRYRVIACDHWLRVDENMRAAGLAIDALHALQRTGATQVIEKAFTGFTALPATAGASRRTWREVFQWRTEWRVTPENIAAQYRLLAFKYHPDTGGTDADMIELNTAREQALAEVTS